MKTVLMKKEAAAASHQHYERQGSDKYEQCAAGLRNGCQRAPCLLGSRARVLIMQSRVISLLILTSPAN